jgi:hypothetical protein
VGADAGGQMRRLVWLTLGGMGALAGCATHEPTIYSWGSYEETIYVSHAEPGKMPPESQIELLEKDYQQARAANKRVPPGWHAHLGYLYFEIGKADQARQELITEKTEFPESTVFVDRLLANLDRK